MNFIRQKIAEWANKNSDAKKSLWWLSVLSFSESSFFLVPPDVMLIGLLVKSKRWSYYALVTTLASVAGGMFGYIIGLFFFDTIGQVLVDFYNLQTEMARVGELFADNAFLAIFVSAFTPIPYKVFTISAGIFKINFLTFVIASILGRGMRFFLVAYLMKLYGEKLGHLAYKYFNFFSLLFGLLVILGIFYFYLN